MTVLPIVARELRVSSRRWGTYVLRLGAATSAIALATLVYLIVSRDGSTPPAKVGEIIFGVLSGFAFLYALLIGVRVTSDCISVEKREGTLGLLFLTDLKGLDIVLGKLAASALDSFYALVSTLPVLAIPILLGSVTADQIWRTMICLLATALFSVCAGVFVSAFSVNERKATAGTFLLITFLAAGIPLLVVILNAYLGGTTIFEWFFTLSPGTGIVVVLVNSPRQLPWETYWWSIGNTIAYALCFSAISAMVVPRIWQQRVEGGNRKAVFRAAAAKELDARRQRQQLLDVSPTCWLSERGHLRGLWLWVFLACVFAGWLWAYAEDPSGMRSLGMNLGWMFFAQGVVKLFVASEAVRIYAEESRQGALELILCTPLRVNDIIRGQLLALARYFRWPMITLLAADLFFLAFGRYSLSYSSDLSTVTQMFVSLMVFFVLDSAAIGLVGLWHGLTARNSRQALTSAIVRILVLPWILYGLINLIAGLGLQKSIPENAQLPLMIVLALLVNGLFAWQAWENLHQNLRLVAASRYGGALRSVWAGRTRKAGGQLATRHGAA
jgi:hypothetical protein